MKKKRNNKYRLPSQSKFIYFVDHEYDYTECEESYEDIKDNYGCRCRSIINATISKYNSENLYQEIKTSSKKNENQELKDFCYSLNEKDFRIFGVRGYYGEEPEVELNSIKYQYLKDLVEKLNKQNGY